MMNGDNGDGVGVERYASSNHGVLPMAWQNQTANSCAAPALRDMDSFAWASVSRSTALSGASLFPPAAAYEHIPADYGGLERAGPSGGSGSKKRRRSDEVLCFASLLLLLLEFLVVLFSVSARCDCVLDVVI